MNRSEIGKFYFSIESEDFHNKELVEKFLKTLIFGIAERSCEYHVETNYLDHVFTDSEDQLGSVICPTIYLDISKIFRTEYPISRSGKERSGKLDYSIYYNDLNIALELKLAHVGYDSDYTIKKSIFKKYNKALKQLEFIEGDERLFFIDKDKGLIKIALEIIVLRKKSKKEIKKDLDKLNIVQKNLDVKFRSLVKTGTYPGSSGLKFNKRVNFSSLWTLDEKYAGLKRKKNGKYRLYPALGFIGNISEYTR